MAVLIEGYSVVVLRSAVELRHQGGWAQFLANVPTWLFAADKDLASIGFETPDEAEAYCEELAEAGMSFGEDGTDPDVAIVDMLEGLLTETEWLEFARVDFDGEGHQISVCWLSEEAEFGVAPKAEIVELDVVVPEGWEYEGSLSANPRFVIDEELDERLEFLRHDASGVDVYRDRTTGELLYTQGSFDEPGDGTND